MQENPHEFLSKEAVSYSLHELARRAGMPVTKTGESDFEILGHPVYYSWSGKKIGDKPAIYIVPVDEAEWYSLVEKSSHSITRQSLNTFLPFPSNLQFHDIPVLFWGAGYEDGRHPFVDLQDDGSIVFYADILAATLFMLSRWEETVITTRDQHDRFPASASVAYKQGFLERPIVDEYALVLRTCLKRLHPMWEPKCRNFSVHLSHDIDSLWVYRNVFEVVRAFGSVVWHQRRITPIVDICRESYYQLTNIEQSSTFIGIAYLSNLSAQFSLKSTFYFMATPDGDPYSNSGYEPSSPLVKKQVDLIRSKGYEVGFHPSYHTYDNLELLRFERNHIAEALGLDEFGGRQHYLRFKVPDTWRYIEEVNLSHDSTMGYADHPGFRCGTCHPFQPFSIEDNRVLNIVERPLIVMDKTLRSYLKMTPEEGFLKLQQLAMACKHVEGEFSLLWHNTSLYNDWLPWKSMYEQSLSRFKVSLQ